MRHFGGGGETHAAMARDNDFRPMQDVAVLNPAVGGVGQRNDKFEVLQEAEPHTDSDQVTWQDVMLNYSTGVFIAVGLGCGVLLMVLLIVCCVCCHYRRLRRHEEDKLIRAAETKERADKQVMTKLCQVNGGLSTPPFGRSSPEEYTDTETASQTSTVTDGRGYVSSTTFSTTPNDRVFRSLPSPSPTKCRSFYREREYSLQCREQSHACEFPLSPHDRDFRNELIPSTTYRHPKYPDSRHFDSPQSWQSQQKPPPPEEDWPSPPPHNGYRYSLITHPSRSRNVSVSSQGRLSTPERIRLVSLSKPISTESLYDSEMPLSQCTPGQDVIHSKYPLPRSQRSLTENIHRSHQSQNGVEQFTETSHLETGEPRPDHIRLSPDALERLADMASPSPGHATDYSPSTPGLGLYQEPSFTRTQISQTADISSRRESVIENNKTDQHSPQQTNIFEHQTRDTEYQQCMEPNYVRHPSISGLDQTERKENRHASIDIENEAAIPLISSRSSQHPAEPMQPHPCAANQKSSDQSLQRAASIASGNGNHHPKLTDPNTHTEMQNVHVEQSFQNVLQDTGGQTSEPLAHSVSRDKVDEYQEIAAALNVQDQNLILALPRSSENRLEQQSASQAPPFALGLASSFSQGGDIVGEQTVFPPPPPCTEHAVEYKDPPPMTCGGETEDPNSLPSTVSCHSQDTEEEYSELPIPPDIKEQKHVSIAFDARNQSNNLPINYHSSQRNQVSHHHCGPLNSSGQTSRYTSKSRDASQMDAFLCQKCHSCTIGSQQPMHEVFVNQADTYFPHATFAAEKSHDVKDTVNIQDRTLIQYYPHEPTLPSRQLLEQDAEGRCHPKHSAAPLVVKKSRLLPQTSHPETLQPSQHTVCPVSHTASWPAGTRALPCTRMIMHDFQFEYQTRPNVDDQQLKMHSSYEPTAVTILHDSYCSCGQHPSTNFDNSEVSQYATGPYDPSSIRGDYPSYRSVSAAGASPSVRSCNSGKIISQHNFPDVMTGAVQIDKLSGCKENQSSVDSEALAANHDPMQCPDFRTDERLPSSLPYDVSTGCYKQFSDLPNSSLNSHNARVNGGPMSANVCDNPRQTSGTFVASEHFRSDSDSAEASNSYQKNSGPQDIRPSDQNVIDIVSDATDTLENVRRDSVRVTHSNTLTTNLVNSSRRNFIPRQSMGLPGGEENPLAESVENNSKVNAHRKNSGSSSENNENIGRPNNQPLLFQTRSSEGRIQHTASLSQITHSTHSRFVQSASRAGIVAEALSGTGIPRRNVIEICSSVSNLGASGGENNEPVERKTSQRQKRSSSQSDQWVGKVQTEEHPGPEHVVSDTLARTVTVSNTDHRMQPGRPAESYERTTSTNGTGRAVSQHHASHTAIFNREANGADIERQHNIPRKSSNGERRGELDDIAQERKMPVPSTSGLQSEKRPFSIKRTSSVRTSHRKLGEDSQQLRSEQPATELVKNSDTNDVIHSIETGRSFDVSARKSSLVVSSQVDSVAAGSLVSEGLRNGGTSVNRMHIDTQPHSSGAQRSVEGVVYEGLASGSGHHVHDKSRLFATGSIQSTSRQLIAGQLQSSNSSTCTKKDYKKRSVEAGSLSETVEKPQAQEWSTILDQQPLIRSTKSDGQFQETKNKLYNTNRKVSAPGKISFIVDQQPLSRSTKSDRQVLEAKAENQAHDLSRGASASGKINDYQAGTSMQKDIDHHTFPYSGEQLSTPEECNRNNAPVKQLLYHFPFCPRSQEGSPSNGHYNITARAFPQQTSFLSNTSRVYKSCKKFCRRRHWHKSPFPREAKSKGEFSANRLQRHYVSEPDRKLVRLEKVFASRCACYASPPKYWTKEVDGYNFSEDTEWDYRHPPCRKVSRLRRAFSNDSHGHRTPPMPVYPHYPCVQSPPSPGRGKQEDSYEDSSVVDSEHTVSHLRKQFVCHERMAQQIPLPEYPCCLFSPSVHPGTRPTEGKSCPDDGWECTCPVQGAVDVLRRTLSHVSKNHRELPFPQYPHYPCSRSPSSSKTPPATHWPASYVCCQEAWPFGRERRHFLSYDRKGKNTADEFSSPSETKVTAKMHPCSCSRKKFKKKLPHHECSHYRSHVTASGTAKESRFREDSMQSDTETVDIKRGRAKVQDLRRIYSEQSRGFEKIPFPKWPHYPCSPPQSPRQAAVGEVDTRPHSRGNVASQHRMKARVSSLAKRYSARPRSMDTLRYRPQQRSAPVIHSGNKSTPMDLDIAATPVSTRSYTLAADENTYRSVYSAQRIPCWQRSAAVPSSQHHDGQKAAGDHYPCGRTCPNLNQPGYVKRRRIQSAQRSESFQTNRNKLELAHHHYPYCGPIRAPFSPVMTKKEKYNVHVNHYPGCPPSPCAGPRNNGRLSAAGSGSPGLHSDAAQDQSHYINHTAPSDHHAQTTMPLREEYMYAKAFDRHRQPSELPFPRYPYYLGAISLPPPPKVANVPCVNRVSQTSDRDLCKTKVMDLKRKFSDQSRDCMMASAVAGRSNNTRQKLPFPEYPYYLGTLPPSPTKVRCRQNDARALPAGLKTRSAELLEGKVADLKRKLSNQSGNCKSSFYVSPGQMQCFSKCGRTLPLKTWRPPKAGKSQSNNLGREVDSEMPQCVVPSLNHRAGQQRTRLRGHLRTVQKHTRNKPLCSQDR